jgi:hypothetical protein
MLRDGQHFSFRLRLWTRLARCERAIAGRCQLPVWLRKLLCACARTASPVRLCPRLPCWRARPTRVTAISMTRCRATFAVAALTFAFETQSSMQLSRPPTHRGADHRRSLELDTWLQGPRAHMDTISFCTRISHAPAPTDHFQGPQCSCACRRLRRESSDDGRTKRLNPNSGKASSRDEGNCGRGWHTAG